MTGGEVLKETARVEKLWQIFIAFVVILNRAAAFGDKLLLKSFIVNIKHGDCAAALIQHFFQNGFGINETVKILEDAV